MDSTKTKSSHEKQRIVRHSPTRVNTSKDGAVEVIAKPVKHTANSAKSKPKTVKQVNNKAVERIAKTGKDKTECPIGQAMKSTGKSCYDDMMEQPGYTHAVYSTKHGDLDEYIDNQDTGTLRQEYERLTAVLKSRKDAVSDNDTEIEAQLKRLTEAKHANEKAAAELDIITTRHDKAENKYQRFQTEANSMYEKRNDVDNEAEDMNIQNQEYDADIVAIITEINNKTDMMLLGKNNIRIRIFEIVRDAYKMQQSNDKLKKRLEKLKNKFDKSLGSKQKRDVILEPENFNACYQLPY